jgi:hypothetical protein
MKAFGIPTPNRLTLNNGASPSFAGMSNGALFKLWL